MNSIDLVDPEHRPFVGGFPIFDPAQTDLSDFRAAVVSAFTAIAPTGPLRGEERQVLGRSKKLDVRTLVYRPVTVPAKTPVIIYIHGGGFFTGTPDMLDAASQALAEASGAVVVAVDYRLAPETSFPGPLEDCYTVLAWLSKQAHILGIDPDRISVLGDSAGGALAAALTLLARDRGHHAIKAQFLIYPMLDARTGTPEAPVDNPTTGEFIWTRDSNRYGWSAMRGSDPIPPEAEGHFSPSLAKDLSGLPAAFLAVGALDLLLDEDVDYALRLSRARVPVNLKVYAGAVHGFDRLPGSLGDRLRRDLSDAFACFL